MKHHDSPVLSSMTENEIMKANSWCKSALEISLAKLGPLPGMNNKIPLLYSDLFALKNAACFAENIGVKKFSQES